MNSAPFTRTIVAGRASAGCPGGNEREIPAAAACLLAEDNPYHLIVEKAERNLNLYRVGHQGEYRNRYSDTETTHESWSSRVGGGAD